MNRRIFLKGAVGAVSAVCLSRYVRAAGDPLPSYLKGYEKQYADDPRKAAVEWFRNAKFGLFMHYGVYSQLGAGEWVEFNKKITLDDYTKLKDTFDPKNFDADFITDLALSAEMKYVNITTKHHDGFCLWDTRQTDFNSVNSPAKRDLVKELAEQCHKKGLGLALYYSHGRCWRHPDSPTYMYPRHGEVNLPRYVEYLNGQITELLSNYGPVANIWFDGWSDATGEKGKPLHIPETYEMIRKLQPACLISYKNGITGTEDFFAPEFGWLKSQKEAIAAAVASGKPIEICNGIAGWGYQKKLEGKHRGADSLMGDLAKVHQAKADVLLLNTGPLPDGSIDKQDVASLREMGTRIRRDGWPVSA